jgi:ABC-type lipoprotein export system ATPase subunit
MGWPPNNSPGGNARPPTPVFEVPAALRAPSEEDVAEVAPPPRVEHPPAPAEPIVESVVEPVVEPIALPQARPSPASPVVELEDVERHFGADPIVRALNGVNLRIERGESIAIVGPSGSGKSTLMNVLGLLDRPTAGRYRLDGIDVEGLSDRERAGVRASRIGFVFQSFHLLAQRTAVENVMLGDAYRAAPRAGRRERAIAVLDRVGLGRRIDSIPTKLSGGECQRVAIARALLGEPSLLLCDEPTGNLDSENTHSVLDLFEHLVGTGLTLVVVTHERDVADRMARQVHMIDGRMVHGETPWWSRIRRDME